MVKIGSGIERGFDDGVKLSRIANAPAIMTTQQPKIMAEKKFKKNADEFVDLVLPMGGCCATDNITVDGMKVGYMYREEPDYPEDSGWRFFSGTEDQNYVDDQNNTMIYDVNTIANYDTDIIPYLDFPVGTELARIGNTHKFQIITSP